MSQHFRNSGCNKYYDFMMISKLYIHIQIKFEFINRKHFCIWEEMYFVFWGEGCWRKLRETMPIIIIIIIVIIIKLKECAQVNRGGFSDLGALSKFQVWGPNTITMCSFTPNPYFAHSFS